MSVTGVELQAAVRKARATTSSLGTPAAAGLSSAAGGALAAATYYVRITYTGAAGESMPSAETSLQVAADNLLSVASPSGVSGATGWNVYAGTAAGAEALQNSTPIAIGTVWAEPATGLIAGSPVPGWGNPAACAAGDGLLIKPHSIKKTRKSLIDDSLGTYNPQDAVNAEIEVKGNLPLYLRYDGLDVLFALAMGSVAGTPVFALPAPSAAPGLSSMAGGTLAAATYYVKTTYTGPNGESAPSPEASLPVAVDDLLEVASPAAQTGATGYNIYVGTASGDETLQNAAPVAIGTPWEEPATGLMAGTAYPANGKGSAYKQSFIIANSLEGLFATFCQDNTVNIDEFTSIKVTGLEIKGDIGKPIEITFYIEAYDRVTDSVINTSVTFAGVTYPETRNRVIYAQGVFLLNNQTAGALAATDAIYPSAFTLTYKRKMKGEYVVGGFNQIDEPTNDGRPEGKLTMKFPRYDPAIQQWFSDWDATTQKKAQFTFTGFQIGTSGFNRVFQIQMPCAQISGADLPVKAGIMEAPLEFVLLACPAAPAGMTATEPFRINVVNQQSANVLAS